jgi:hypothetical protein
MLKKQEIENIEMKKIEREMQELKYNGNNISTAYCNYTLYSVILGAKRFPPTPFLSLSSPKLSLFLSTSH